jgi:hypothetical protein
MLVIAVLRLQYLYGDMASQLAAFGFVHICHSAGTDLSQYFIPVFQ